MKEIEITEDNLIFQSKEKGCVLHGDDCCHICNPELYTETCEHKWKGQQVGGSPEDHMSTEWVCYCELCGMEKQDE